MAVLHLARMVQIQGPWAAWSSLAAAEATGPREVHHKPKKQRRRARKHAFPPKRHWPLAYPEPSSSSSDPLPGPDPPDPTTHDVVDKGNSLYCTRCCQNISKSVGNDTIDRWLDRPCASVVENPSKPVEQAKRAVFFKRSETHDSHKLYYHKDMKLWWCSSCGGYGSHQLRSLAKPCPKKMSKTGACNVARIQKDMMPGYTKEAQVYNKGRVRRHVRFASK